jgi:hypothetical protein
MPPPFYVCVTPVDIGRLQVVLFLAQVTCYRFGSIGQDTQLCLWDLTDDVLKHPVKNRTSMVFGSFGAPLSSPSSSSNHADASTTTLSQKLSSAVNLDGKSESKPKPEKKNFSFSRDKSSSAVKGAESSGAGGGGNAAEDRLKLIGTPACPRLEECPMLEPIVNKKISYERLTALVFKEDCFVVACQDGIVATWARPDRTISSMEML